MSKIPWGSIAIVGAIALGGYFLYSKFSGIFGGISDIFGGVGSLFGIREEKSPEEMTTEELQKIISVPGITQYDPFGISGIMQDIARSEIKTRGIDIPAEEYFEYQQLETVATVPPLDPFGISEIFKEKAVQQIEEKYPETISPSPQSVVRGYEEGLPTGAISIAPQRLTTEEVSEMVENIKSNLPPIISGAFQ